MPILRYRAQHNFAAPESAQCMLDLTDTMLLHCILRHVHALAKQQAAVRAHQQLGDAGMRTSMGITTGRALCSNIGSELRCEYAMVSPYSCVSITYRDSARVVSAHLALCLI
jgi:class 3 adenylate cyclase